MWFCISESWSGSRSQSLKSGSHSLAVSNSPFYTPSFALFLFSIPRLAFFYVWINCDTKHMFWLAENLLCKLYHWTSKKTQKICFHFKLFYKLKDQTKSFLLDYFHNCTLELSWEWDLEDVVSFSIICMLVSCEGFLCWSVESLGCCLTFSLLIIARGKNPDIQISFVKFWKIK